MLTQQVNLLKHGEHEVCLHCITACLCDKSRLAFRGLFGLSDAQLDAIVILWLQQVYCYIKQAFMAPLVPCCIYSQIEKSFILLVFVEESLAVASKLFTTKQGQNQSMALHKKDVSSLFNLEIIKEYMEIGEQE